MDIGRIGAAVKSFRIEDLRRSEDIKTGNLAPSGSFVSTEQESVDNTEVITFGSLFSGGGGLDKGLEDAGLKCVFQVENDRHCLTILNKHWPDVPKNEIRPCMGLVGGDPCPIRSRASFLRGTIKPDLSGYFLAMAARCKPRWILRENVPSPDAVDFHAALVLLGYRSIIVGMDSAAFTGQSRRREFVAAFNEQELLDRFIGQAHDAEDDKRHCTAKYQASKAWMGPPLYCLTARSFQLDCRENYVWEGPQRGLRLLSHAERESLQGFPPGWTMWGIDANGKRCAIPNGARECAVGNAVTVPVARWLGERIREALKNP